MAPKIRRTQTSFVAGELSPSLRGRRDVEAYYDGLQTLRNMLVRPQGSAIVRPGLRHVTQVTGNASVPGHRVRLADFVFADGSQEYVVCFVDFQAKIYEVDDASPIATLTTPWSGEELSEIDFLQLSDTMLVAHKNHRLREIVRDRDEEGNAVFSIGNFRFDDSPPQERYFPRCRLRIFGTLTRNSEVEIQAQDGDRTDAFRESDVDEVWGIGPSRFKITGFINQTRVDATLLDEVPTDGLLDNQVVPSPLWTQQAHGLRRGHYRAVAFYQDRLWLGGTRDAPFQLWGSRVGLPSDFKPAGVNDDDPVKVGVSTGRSDPIRHLVPGFGGLEVYTAATEGFIPGGADQPITPRTLAYEPQTDFGSRFVKPTKVDAQTLFVQRDRGTIRRFVFSDVEQAFNARSISLRAEHLFKDPRRITSVTGGFGQQSDFVVVVDADGTGAILTTDVAEGVEAWASFTSRRTILDARTVGSRVYVATGSVEDPTDVFLEFLDPSARWDSQRSLSSGAPSATWPGLGHLAGVAGVELFADGYWRGPLPAPVPASGVLTTQQPYRSIEVGLPIDLLVMPMPVELEGEALLGLPIRPVRCHIQFLSSAGLRVNGRLVGDRPFDRADVTPPTPASTTRRVQLLGWRKDAQGAVVVTREGPFPVEILSLVVEYAVGSA